MPDSNHERLRRIFDTVMDSSRAERAGLLERECAGDAALRERVEAMIAAAEDDRFLGSPTADVHPSSMQEGHTVDTPARASAPRHLRLDAVELGEKPGSRIGPYKLLQLIGEGGFGSVFMAEQEKPVARKVALKIIKLGMDTRQVVARFEQERQALAMMDHPNIARVLDAGATETGRPYFVMDLVKGDPISEYCDKNSLDIASRLELFAQVCQAVQHAHSKGIIHRDIKPSNVLVSTQDGRPLAKVIDFGIAKATASKLTEKTLFTEHRQLIGTPEYMSPEQAEGNLDIDTRTDVYSLGVLLYELLTGSTPFDSKSLRSAAFQEIQRIIREVDPPKPSTRLSQSVDTLASIAASRRTEPRKLGLIVRGDLDWIVMKALEKDRQRRYETANGLAMDVRRYLAGEAVSAAPPSSAYRFKKFVRRNRVLVASGTAVGLTLLCGIIGTSVGLAQAVRARGDERAARIEAQRQADIAREVNQFLTGDLLSSIDPTRTHDRQITVREVVDAASRRIGSRFEKAPVIGGSIENVLGQLYARLGEFEPAERHAQRAYELLGGALGPNDRATLDARGSRDDLLYLTGRYAEGISTAEDTIGVMTAALGPDDRLTLMERVRLAMMLSKRLQYERADAIFADAVARFRATLGAAHRDTIGALNNFAQSYMERQMFDKAEPLLAEGHAALQSTIGEEDPDALELACNLGWTYVELGDPAKGEQITARALGIARRVLGEDHHTTQLAVNNLAVIYVRTKRFELAEPLYVEGLEVTRRTLGPEHPDLLPSLHNLGKLYSANLKQYTKAEPLLAEAVEKARRTLERGDFKRGAILLTYGDCLINLEKPRDAVAVLLEANESLSVGLGPEHPACQRLFKSLASAYTRLGDEASAALWQVKLLPPPSK